MNREIKFKAKSTLTQKRLNSLGVNHDKGWVIGYLVMSGNVPYIIGDIVDSDEDYISPAFWTPVRPKTVGQFTGLKDKNGKDIYEGDILEFPFLLGRSQVVYWFSGFAILDIGDNHPVRQSSDVYQSGEIIGNIHQNPELLK